ncbi:7-cyano-7-deazaguanine synthase [Rhodococcus sp. IEGM 1318]|uniref:7-cyano-7-deazaguanine synthase n=1 Tax=Rhodococcus sp. IEGM 1318 TaxID=3082226 RepID=UPI0029548297|nr:7-cyano-7-deazaguanine synthase [Rhodococcus sp. IEGM 1318]MDV8008959.1 7-cyano-7-deazaguanine synthase [Rhodococcus sp. IEGM 1318]
MERPLISDRALLLLSGGHDSIALAAWLSPAACLTIDYGQRPVEGELRSAQAAAQALNLAWHSFRVDLTPVGSGLLHEDGEIADPDAGEFAKYAPTPEWWPYRNQLLVSLAAAWALRRGFDEILVGSVAPDGDRHKDGTTAFYSKLDEVVAYQEGGLRVAAPAIEMSTVELIEVSGVPDNILGFAHSCHVGAYPCGMCPGCRKHDEVIAQTGRFK